MTRWSWYRIAPAALAIGLIAILVASAADPEEGKSELKSHLTLYVGGELLRDGGTVIVASIPVPEAKLRSMTGPNPAADDPENAKRVQLSDRDVLLGAHISGRANFVEMYYPEDGTFGFNLVPDASENGRNLRTERILVGDGGWTDWTTGVDHVWPDVSTIYVHGPVALQSEGQLLRSVQSRIMNLDPPYTKYQGVTVFTPTGEQLREGTWGKIDE